MNKLGRCYIQNIKALGLPVLEKKNFEDGFLCSYIPTCELLCRASFDPWGIMNKLGRGPQGDATYQISRLNAFQFQRKKNEVCLLCSYDPISDPQGGASFDPRCIICTNLVEVHREMKHTKC